MSLSWKPSAKIKSLQQKGELLREIREFFWQKNVLEVETPLLSNSTVTDPYMDALSITFPGEQAKFLQTSPEYAMKRLLAAGSGSIYQICKAFRAQEFGQYHHQEFSMLEWYREGFQLEQLMDEVFELLSLVIGIKKQERLSYQKLFQQFLDFDPFTISFSELKALSHDLLGGLNKELFFDDYLSLLFSTHIEPHLGQESICFVYDYPPSQAALAQLRQENPIVASRFEVYCQGIELANGFHELTDSAEQAKRFKDDLEKRNEMNKAEVPIDYELLAALEAGLPECSGVALGIDRLLMIRLGLKDIQQVIAFPEREGR